MVKIRIRNILINSEVNIRIKREKNFYTTQKHTADKLN